MPHKSSISGKENDKSSLMSYSEYETTKAKSDKAYKQFNPPKNGPVSYYINLQPGRSKSHSLHNSEKKVINPASRNYERFNSDSKSNERLSMSCLNPNQPDYVIIGSLQNNMFSLPNIQKMDSYQTEADHINLTEKKLNGR